MALLRLYGRDVTSFFQLMGTSENDITISLAWMDNATAYLMDLKPWWTDFPAISLTSTRIYLIMWNW